MIKGNGIEYKNLLEELRLRYKQKYNVLMDDEILYLIIRMNELQVDLKKEIKSIPKTTFRKGLDYFWYGVGKTVGFLIFGIGLLVVGGFLFDANQTKKTYQVIESDTGNIPKLENYNLKGDSTIRLTEKKKDSK